MLGSFMKKLGVQEWVGALLWSRVRLERRYVGGGGGGGRIRHV